MQAGGGSRQICLKMDRESYGRIWANPREVRALIHEQLRQTPELFPAGMEAGFRLTGHLPESARLPGICLRQVRMKNADGTEAVDTLRPCFVMPCMAGFADDAHLADAYGTFHAEALQVDPNDSPKSVNTDGWKATQNAWQAMFPTVTVILCCLHGFRKIRDRCRKSFTQHKRIWDVFRATTADEFTQRMQTLRSSAQPKAIP